MIQTIYPYIKKNLIKTYSDEGYYIKQVETGIIYEEAVDVYPCRYTYEETEEKIPTYEEDNKETIEEAETEITEENEEVEYIN